MSDEEGWFYGIDAVSGEILWKQKTQAAAGAAAVGPDGTVYALQSSGASVIAMRADGEVAWRSDGSALDLGLPDSWLLGEAEYTANGNPVVTETAVLVPMMYGYRIPFTEFRIPVSSQVIALDIHTGKAVRVLAPLVDDSSGITGVLPDGTLTNSLGAVMTSALAPLDWLLNWLLPGDLELLPVQGGLQISRPKDQ